MVEQQIHRLDQQNPGCRALLDGEHLELPPRLGFQPQGPAPARAIVFAGRSLASCINADVAEDGPRLL